MTQKERVVRRTIVREVTPKTAKTPKIKAKSVNNNVSLVPEDLIIQMMEALEEKRFTVVSLAKKIGLKTPQRLHTVMKNPEDTRINNRYIYNLKKALSPGNMPRKGKEEKDLIKAGVVKGPIEPKAEKSVSTKLSIIVNKGDSGPLMDVLIKNEINFEIQYG